MEELVGEEHQQRGDGLKQDAVSDVTAKDTEHMVKVAKLAFLAPPHHQYR